MINKIFSWVLIFTLSFNCLSKLGYVTYYQVNRSYIAEFLCINKKKPELKCEGTCFLKKKLDLAEQSQNKSENIVKQLEIPVFLIMCSEVLFLNRIHVAENYAQFKELYSFQNIDKVFHPPICFIS
jgi:hypothetical protein